MVPSTTLNIHSAHCLAARTRQTLGAPVTVRVLGKDHTGDTEITFYVQDQEYAERLVEAINKAYRPRLVSVEGQR